MKYKKGDRLRIVSEPPEGLNWASEMNVYLGRVMTIKNVLTRGYKMVEDKGEWFWGNGMIAGLASEVPFDFDAWKDKNVCMHCKTEEEAEDFCREMNKAGLLWSSGNSYLSWSCFDSYKEQMCYCFNKGTYDSTVYAKDKGYTILEWSEYRSTEPKEEQEKIMETKSDNKPLSYQEAMKIKKRICLSMRGVCVYCSLSLYNNDTTKSCDDFMLDHPDMAEPILKEWIAEHPFKTNKGKLNEMFLEVFGMQYATALKKHSDWWQEEYIEPNKEQE